MQASDAHHVTGTATYTVGVVPGLSVSLSGALRYSGAGPVTSGAITVAPTGSTAIRSITGRAALPGASGGTAAVTFSL